MLSHNPEALMLPDLLTEGDNLELPEMSDPSLLMSQLDSEVLTPRKRRSGYRDITLQDDVQASQFLEPAIEQAKHTSTEDMWDPMEAEELDLDFGDGAAGINVQDDFSIEVGRDAPDARDGAADLVSELDIRLHDKDNLDPNVDREQSLQLNFDDDNGIQFADDADVDMMNLGADITNHPRDLTMDRPRISESPLSDVDEDVLAEAAREQAQQMDKTFDQTQDEEDNESTIVAHNPPQRRNKKVLEPDNDTTIPRTVINDMVTNHKKLLRPQSFLPRDPQVIALMELQRNGGFVSSVLGDHRSKSWAPELRGMISLDAVLSINELKRKRDSGITDMDIDEENASKSPRLELGEDTDLEPHLQGSDDRANQTGAEEDTVLQIPGDEEDQVHFDDETLDRAGQMSMHDNFDDTAAPLVHPADSGPVSLGTKHAVHLLRDHFGADAADSPNKRKQSSVRFQDLLPESTTSKADATKMFFEILVLATKDAVKIEQKSGELGGPIQIRGKRGLWGDWAEREAGGEIDEEEHANAHGPGGPALVSASA